MAEKSDNNNSWSANVTQFGNQIAVWLLKFLALLPLWFLYGISNILFVLLKHVIKYRSKVILENLAHAFPEKPEEELLILRNKFYRFFCDITVESIKLRHMSVKQLEKRIRFTGADLLNEYALKNNGAVLLAFHYNNWEWASALQLKLQPRVLMVYNKMRNNEPMDRFLQKAREKCGGKAVQMGRAAKVAFEYAHKKEPAVLGLIADQSALESSQSWTRFLNREAAFFTGPQKIARHTNQPVFFQQVKRLGRGHYEYSYSLIHAEPAKAAPNEILLRYVQKMEELIKTEPEYYLWSHKRWKHKRPVGTDLI